MWRLFVYAFVSSLCLYIYIYIIQHRNIANNIKHHRSDIRRCAVPAEGSGHRAADYRAAARHARDERRAARSRVCVCTLLVRRFAFVSFVRSVFCCVSKNILFDRAAQAIRLPSASETTRTSRCTRTTRRTLSWRATTRRSLCAGCTTSTSTSNRLILSSNSFRLSCSFQATALDLERYLGALEHHWPTPDEILNAISTLKQNLNQLQRNLFPFVRLFVSAGAVWCRVGDLLIRDAPLFSGLCLDRQRMHVAFQLVGKNRVHQTMSFQNTQSYTFR